MCSVQKVSISQGHWKEDTGQKCEIVQDRGATLWASRPSELGRMIAVLGCGQE